MSSRWLSWGVEDTRFSGLVSEGPTDVAPSTEERFKFDSSVSDHGRVVKLLGFPKVHVRLYRMHCISFAL